MSISRIDEAFAQMAQGDASAAAALLRGVLRVAPGYTPAYVLGAQACEALHEWPEALRLWHGALLLAPALDVARKGVLRATRVIAALNDLETSGEDAGAPVAAPMARARLEPPPPPRADPPATYSSLTEIDLGLQEGPREAPAGSELADDVSVEAEAPVPPLEDLPRFNAPPPPPDVFTRDTPAPPAEPRGLGRTFDLDLDGLIEQLNTQGRITPRPDLDAIPAPDLEDDGEDMVSETLARIYATQGQYDEAARIYELLAAQQPEKAKTYQQQAASLRQRAGDE